MKMFPIKRGFFDRTGFRYLIAAVASFAAAGLFMVNIRKYVLDSHFWDYGANWYLPSFFFMTGLSFLVISVRWLRRHAILVLSGLIIGAALQEISQYFQPVNNFDVRDLIATMAGGITVLVFFLVQKKHDET